jgi:hypothetical protein
MAASAKQRLERRRLAAVGVNGILSAISHLRTAARTTAPACALAPTAAGRRRSKLLTPTELR